MKRLISILLISICGRAFAQTEIDQREQNQAERTEKGVESGSLTKHEASRLDRQQKRIEKQEANMEKRDGGDNLTDRQKARLKREQNRESRAIARKKHNARNGK